MGEHKLGSSSVPLSRLSTGFGGGLGGTRQELCGALSGGVMVIGALYGRTDADQDKSRPYHLAACFRERFAQAFGATICQDLRDAGYGTSGPPCTTLVEKAARLLLEILAEG